MRLVSARLKNGGPAHSWRLNGQDSFAERALAEMRSKHIASGGKASRAWVDYARRSLAFDWLLGIAALIAHCRIASQAN